MEESIQALGTIARDLDRRQLFLPGNSFLVHAWMCNCVSILIELPDKDLSLGSGSLISKKWDYMALSLIVYEPVCNPASYPTVQPTYN